MVTYEEGDFIQVLDLLVSRQLGGVQIALFEELFQEWGDKDPQAAIAKAAGLPAHLRGRAMLHVMEPWLRKDDTAAREWLKGLPYDGVKEALIGELCRKLGSEDIKGMMALIDENKLPNSRLSKSTLLFHGAGSDPEYAIAYALQHPNRELKGNALMSAVWHLMQSNPGAIQRYLNSEEGASNRRSLLNGLLSYYSTEAPKKGLEVFAKEWTLFSQITAWDQNSFNTLSSTLNRAFDKDPKKILEWLGNQPETDLKGQTIQNVIRNLDVGQRDVLMNSFSKADLLKESNSQALAALIGYSSVEDFPGMMHWLSDNGDRLNFETHDVILREFSYNLDKLSSDSFSKATQLAAAFRDEKAVGDFAERMASLWNKRDPALFESLLADAPDGFFRDSLMTGLFKATFSTNAIDGIAKVDALEPGAMKDRLTIVGLVNAQRDFEALVPWAAKAPETATLNAVLSQAVRRWAHYDAQGASKWVAGLPAGVRRDATAASLAKAIAVNDPANAIDWARSIQNQERQAETLESVAAAWKRFDEKAAIDWITRSDLSQKSKDKLLKK